MLPRSLHSLLMAVACLGLLPTAQLLGQSTAPGQMQGITIETGGQAEPLVLSGRDSGRQLVVTGRYTDGTLRDLTRQAVYAVTATDVVRVAVTGWVTPQKEGQAVIRVQVGASMTSIQVVVRDLEKEKPVSFTNQVVPIFTRQGCNTGGCHGKTGGQNGFAMSLFGFEPGEDYDHLVRESRTRRLLPTAPEHSLLLRKATGSVGHAGGKRLEKESPHYRLLQRWISQGMPADNRTDPTVTRIEVLPRARVLPRGAEQQLAVLAHFSDGSSADVTQLAQFEVNDTEMAKVSSTGLVTAKQPVGSVAVMARFQTHVDVFRVLIPLGAPVGQLPAARNYIDELVSQQWRDLGLPPSAPCDDATFLRRVTIDIAGRLPTLEEAKSFLASKNPNRHEQLVDRLLASPDYAYYFAGKWSAVLRNRRKSDKDDPKVTKAFHGWIKDSLERNRPFDQLVRELLVASGKQPEHPQVAWYGEVNSINDQVEDVAQLFLGQRITCARCHHHPLEKWSQQDYWAMAAFFARVEFKHPPAPKKQKGMKETPPRPPMEVLFKTGKAETRNPRTGQLVRPTGLGGKELTLTTDADPRPQLVQWMVEPGNPFFARALVNRYWKHFFGRGLVEPEDDLRITNPSTNPALLDALAQDFTKNKYDLKKLIRAICTAQAYRLSSLPNEYNAEDRQNYSRFQPRRLSAEVLLDAIDDLAQVRSTFKGVPGGTRAVQLFDNQVDSYFLSVFGRPDFASACECERSGDANLAQSLHLLNSKDVLGKIAKGRAAKLAKDKRPEVEKIRELYLVAFSREPSAEELQTLQAYLQRHSGSLQATYEDIVWSIINTKEFLFNH